MSDATTTWLNSLTKETLDSMVQSQAELAAAPEAPK